MTFLGAAAETALSSLTNESFDSVLLSGDPFALGKSSFNTVFRFSHDVLSTAGSDKALLKYCVIKTIDDVIPSLPSCSPFCLLVH